MTCPAVDLDALIDAAMVERFGETCRRRKSVEAGLRLVAQEVAKAIMKADREIKLRAAVRSPSTSCRCAECIDAVIAGTAGLLQMDVSELLTYRRLPHLVRARWVVMLALQERGVSLKQIAAALHLKNHTTVVHGLREIEDHPELLDVARIVGWKVDQRHGQKEAA